MASAVGRGRGRGRGLYTVPARRPGEITQEESTGENTNFSHGSVTSLDDLRRVVDEFRDSDCDSCDRLVEEVKKFATNELSLSNAVEQICQMAFNDPELAPRTALICSKLCGTQFDNGLSFRVSLLRKTQEFYKGREKVHERSINEWVGLVSFICQLFKSLRVNGQLLKPLVTPIYQMLNELLRGRQREEITCFYRQLKDMGSLLDTVDEEKMNELYMQMRILLVDSGSTELTRLLLLELIELRSGKWSMSKDNAQYFAEYCKDLLGN